MGPPRSDPPFPSGAGPGCFRFELSDGRGRTDWRRGRCAIPSVSQTEAHWDVPPPHFGMAWTVKTTASTIGKAVDGKWNRETGSRGPETMPVARIAPARGGWVRWNRTGMRGRWTCGTKNVLVVHAAPNPSPGDPDPNTETEKNPLDFPQVRDASRQCSAQSTRTCATSGAIGTRNRLPGRRRREKGSCDA